MSGYISPTRFFRDFTKVILGPHYSFPKCKKNGIICQIQSGWRQGNTIKSNFEIKEREHPLSSSSEEPPVLITKFLTCTDWKICSLKGPTLKDSRSCLRNCRKTCVFLLFFMFHYSSRWSLTSQNIHENIFLQRCSEVGWNIYATGPVSLHVKPSFILQLSQTLKMPC